MRAINLGVLIVCITVWLLTACGNSPAPAPITPTPPPPSTVPPEVSPTWPPAPLASPALPTRFPSLAPTQFSTTSRPTTAPNYSATARLAQTVGPPTVASEGWDTDTLLVGPGNPGRLYALQGDHNARYFNSAKRRLLVSDDLGDTWKPFLGGLPVPPDCLANVDLDYAARETLYVSTCQGLFRWSADRWTLITSQKTLQVAIVYGRPQEIWAITPLSSGGPVLRSDDGGKTWDDASAGLVHFSGLATLAIDPRNAQTVYGIIMPKYGGSYLRRLFVGSAWHTLPTPLDNRQIDTGMTIDGATGDLYVTTFIEQGWQLWRTRNPQASDPNGLVWEKVSAFTPGPWGYASVLASGMTPQGLALFVKLAPTNCNSFDAQCDPFVQRSLDGGKTWKRMVIR